MKIGDMIPPNEVNHLSPLAQALFLSPNKRLLNVTELHCHTYLLVLLRYLRFWYFYDANT